MLSISSVPRTVVRFGGSRYKLNTAYDVVLRVIALQRDVLFTPEQRITLAVEMFGGWRAKLLRLNDKIQFLQLVFTLLSDGAKKAGDGEPRVLDFEQDAALIFAGFWQAYGINLAGHQGLRGWLWWRRARLDWRYFLVLLQGLPDDTLIKEVVDIRRRPMPKPTKHNAEEIQALAKAKAQVAIRLTPEEAEEMFQKGVDRLAAGLFSRARAMQSQSAGGGV